MISTKTAAVVAMLAVAAPAAGQGRVDEQRIARLIDELDGGSTAAAAAEELMAMGPRGRTAIPSLLRALHDPDPSVALAVIRALGSIGPYVPGTTATIEAEISNRVFVAARADARTDPVTRELFGRLIKAMYRGHGRLRVDPSADTDALIETLRSDDHSESRARAAQMAGRNEAAEKVLPALRYAMGVEHPDRFRYEHPGGTGHGVLVFNGTKVVRLAAARAIRSLAPRGEEGEEVSILLMREGSAAEALQSVLGLRETANPTIERWVFGLCYRLDNADNRLTQEIVATLGTLGPRANHSIYRLEPLTGHDDPQIAKRAKTALRQIRGR